MLISTVKTGCHNKADVTTRVKSPLSLETAEQGTWKKTHVMRYVGRDWMCP